MRTERAATGPLCASSPEEMRELGRLLGACAQPGDLIGLTGDLGAGKTTLAQGIGVGLGLPEYAVTSPTFILAAEHLDGRIPFCHLDAYRLDSAGELYHLGFDDTVRRADGLIVIEWAERVAEGLPADRLQISLSDYPGDPGRRRLEASAGGPRSARLLADWMARCR